MSRRTQRQLQTLQTRVYRYVTLENKNGFNFFVSLVTAATKVCLGFWGATSGKICVLQMWVFGLFAGKERFFSKTNWESAVISGRPLFPK